MTSTSKLTPSLFRLTDTTLPFYGWTRKSASSRTSSPCASRRRTSITRPALKPLLLVWHDDLRVSPSHFIFNIGWGAMEANSRERPLELQAVDVKVVNSTRCERWHRGNHIYVRIPLPLPETNRVFR